MARIDWVDHGLNNWARWKVSGGSGGRASSVLTSASLFDTRVRSRTGYRETPIPITDHEAQVMDRAVQDLQVKDERLHRTVELSYLSNLTRLGVAVAEGISERTVHARLEEADLLIATWFRLRAEARASPKVF